MNLQKSIALRQLICAFYCQVQNKNVYASLARQDSNILYHMTARITHKRQRWSQGHKARGQGQGHKKMRDQGQGQPFRGKTLSRSRAGMLEAKAKNYGHKRKCSPKKKRKKGLQNFFPAISKNKVFKIFFQTFPSKKRLLKFFFRR